MFFIPKPDGGGPLVPAPRRQRQANLRVQGHSGLQGEFQDHWSYIKKNPVLKKEREREFFILAPLHGAHL